jgi:NO-binding membrane sensor protein with MHYT domain
MAHIHHFEHGWVTPAVSYTLSVLGSLLGLICTSRVPSALSAGWRAWWLMLAAVAIGGTGIWTMHFVAMLGFSVTGLPIRYDVGMTALSAVIAIAAVGIGLFIVAGGTRARAVRLVAGGLCAGLGVAAMHFTGMYAMRIEGSIDYLTSRVVAAVIIAVVAATVALWLATTVRRPAAIVASALVMGLAVNGMHFTGMSAMSVRADPGAVGAPDGASASTLLIPIGLAVFFGVLGLAYALLAAPTDEDRAAAAYLASRLDRNQPAAPPTPGRSTPGWSTPGRSTPDRPTMAPSEESAAQQAAAQQEWAQHEWAQQPPAQQPPAQHAVAQHPAGQLVPLQSTPWTFRDRVNQ